jgi:hypothetical protein
VYLLTELEEKIGYRFKNPNYLKTALTHSSYANEHKIPGGSNERLDFWEIPFLGWWYPIIYSNTFLTFLQGFDQKEGSFGL